MTRSERFWFWLAWRLPRRLVYFANVRLVAEVSARPAFGAVAMSDIRAMDAAQAWDKAS